MRHPLPTGIEFQLMVSGKPYLSNDPELVAARARARSLEFRFNHTPPEESATRSELLRELLGSTGQSFEIEPNLHVDYGFNIHLGERFYANANCVLLDVAEIRIGDDTMLAPGVQLLTATHPVDAQERISGRELGFPDHHRQSRLARRRGHRRSGRDDRRRRGHRVRRGRGQGPPRPGRCGRESGQGGAGAVSDVAGEVEAAEMTYQAVVFDQDGTLINTFIPAMHAYSVAVGREITLTELEPVAHLGAARNLVSALLGHDATDAEDDVFHDALAAEVARIEPYPGILDLLVALRDAGVATAVATNSDARSAAVVLGAHGLDALFDTVVTVDLVSGPKPEPGDDPSRHRAARRARRSGGVRR